MPSSKPQDREQCYTMQTLRFGVPQTILHPNEHGGRQPFVYWPRKDVRRVLRRFGKEEHQERFLQVLVRVDNCPKGVNDDHEKDKGPNLPPFNDVSLLCDVERNFPQVTP
jgi:hypothetical protein